jgi:hypothetical protein
MLAKTKPAASPKQQAALAVPYPKNFKKPWMPTTAGSNKK